MTSEFQSVTQFNSGVPDSPSYQDLTAQYDRLLQSPGGGTYDFTLQAPKLARVLVNGTLLLDNEASRDNGQMTKQVDLAPGNHHIQLRYHDKEGEATLRFCIGDAMAKTNLLEITQLGNKATIS
ncbi:MAG: hypothetical protein ACRBB0_13485 [Pelagimonas sp.]|uniref:hypothetical protein n=1 Tax=Pelagimonas sp. TaxID=2073170 RepID=UPI003D6BB168